MNENQEFLFSGKMSLAYAIHRDSTTTITSTEISEFEKLKPLLKNFEGVHVLDIENSSTSKQRKENET